MKALKEVYNMYHDGDQWGNAMGFFFAVADYLCFDTDIPVPDSWGFRPSPLGPDDESYQYREIETLIEAGEITDQDVLRFGRILNRLTDIYRAKGIDY